MTSVTPIVVDAGLGAALGDGFGVALGDGDALGDADGLGDGFGVALGDGDGLGDGEAPGVSDVPDDAEGFTLKNPAPAEPDP